MEWKKSSGWEQERIYVHYKNVSPINHHFRWQIIARRWKMRKHCRREDEETGFRWAHNTMEKIESQSLVIFYWGEGFARRDIKSVECLGRVSNINSTFPLYSSPAHTPKCRLKTLRRLFLTTKIAAHFSSSRGERDFFIENSSVFISKREGKMISRVVMEGDCRALDRKKEFYSVLTPQSTPALHTKDFFFLILFHFFLCFPGFQ